jgi:hypothetical protein
VIVPRDVACDRCAGRKVCTGVPGWACDGCTAVKKPCTVKGEGVSGRKPRATKGKGKRRAESDGDDEDGSEPVAGPSRATRKGRGTKRRKVAESAESEDEAEEAVNEDEDELAAAVRVLGRVFERWGKDMGAAFGQVADALAKLDFSQGM